MSINKYLLISISISAVLLGIFPSKTAAQFSSSTNFQIQAGVIDSSGGYSTSTSFRLFGNIPYIEAGNTTSTSFQLNSGFPFTSTSSAIVVSTPGDTPTTGGGITSGSIPNIFNTPSSTDIASYISIIQNLLNQANSLLIQQRSRPTLITEYDGELPIQIIDIFGLKEPSITNIFKRRLSIGNYDLPSVTEIYKRLIQTRFIPAFIALIIVILIFMRKKR